MSRWGRRIPLASRIGGAVARYAMAWSQRLDDLAVGGPTGRAALQLGASDTPQFARIGLGLAAHDTELLRGWTAPGNTNFVAYFANTATYAASRCLAIGLDEATPATGDHYVSFINAADGSPTYPGQIRGDGAGGISYYSASDARGKMDIQRRATPEALSVAAQVGALVSTWEPLVMGAEARRGVGWVAQELYPLAPEAVAEPTPGVPYEEDGGQWGLEKAALIPLAFEALSDAHAKIAALEARIAALEGA